MNAFNKHLRQYMNALSSLMPIPYQTIHITYGSINYFDKSTKENNDEYNKSREYIIGAVIHDAIHKDYIYSPLESIETTSSILYKHSMR